MSISSQMQVKIGKTNKLIDEGYSLTKLKYGFVDLKNSSGRSISVFGIFRSSAVFFLDRIFLPFRSLKSNKRVVIFLLHRSLVCDCISC